MAVRILHRVLSREGGLLCIDLADGYGRTTETRTDGPGLALLAWWFGLLGGNGLRVEVYLERTL
jgi:hypothetical protein